ncbi:hypothetical protein [Streptomyces sp. NPDC048224]|uniref:hypothetical protein n=1 Tax=Streptomyces sp. NPDC048224 TaxID=3154500 RepID=UPI00340F3DC5
MYTGERWAAVKSGHSLPPAEQDTNRRNFAKGAIPYRTDRAVTFRTDMLLWSSPRPRQQNGKGFDVVSAGWNVYHDGFVEHWGR